MTDVHRKAATVRALLAKAESAAEQFPDEARSLVAKAQELMARYQIDEALVAEADDEPERIVELRVELGSGPYVLGRLRLLDAVAAASGLRLLTSRAWEGRVGHLIGPGRTATRAEALYTSLLTQATAEALATKRPSGVPARTVQWRRSFLLGYADEIGTILASATAEATAHAHPQGSDGAHPGGSGRSVALVLAEQRDRVDAWVRERYGRVGAMRPSQAATR